MVKSFLSTQRQKKILHLLIKRLKILGCSKFNILKNQTIFYQNSNTKNSSPIDFISPIYLITKKSTIILTFLSIYFFDSKRHVDLLFQRKNIDTQNKDGYRAIC